MFIRSASGLTRVFMFVFLLGATADSTWAQSGCQDQYCSWSVTRGCFQCVLTTGFWCSLGKGRQCPQQCSSGTCASSPSSLSTSETVRTPPALLTGAQIAPSAVACSASLEEIKKNKTGPVTAPEDTIGFVSAWQADSPVLIVEETVAVENGNFILKQVVLKNVTDVPVTVTCPPFLVQS
jgi:hypothetical protein